jgi:hypothetical protein
MVGSRLAVRSGPVRVLTVEAGWPRAPRHGVVRGGGLARARVSHFGDRGADEELLLVKPNDEEAPRWIVVADDEQKARARRDATREGFDESRARAHVEKLVG